MKVRKLATAAAVSMALASGGARALSLGEIEMRSALNQPIDAEIGLSSVEAGELDGMIVKLASAEAFARAGIERSRVLTDLKFEVSTGANGQPVILVSSRKPVLEPFLNFLVDVDWRGGRLVREYTVLLDPPVFMTPSASARDTSADTPATIPVAPEDSILTPLPIDRTALDSSAGEFDESTVELLGDVVEIGDDQVSAVDVDLGGVEVELDSIETTDTGLGEVVELGGVDEVGDDFAGQLQETFTEDSVVVIPGAEDESGAVALGELSQSSTFSTGLATGSTFNPETGWEVQVMGDTTEVSDDVGASVASLETVTLLSEEAGAEIDLSDASTTASSSGSQGGSAIPGEELLVNKNDTLWEIAESNKLEGLSTQQMMLALLEANQQAFINGNINLVKAGAVLRIPDAGSVSTLSQAQALAEVNSQEQLWREYRDTLRGVQSNRTAVATAPESSESESGADATEESTSTSAAAQKILEQARNELEEQRTAELEQGEQAAEQAAEQAEQAEQAGEELKIVADNTATSTVASATADETDTPETDRLGSINRKLQLAREELAAARLESEELASQSTELDSVTGNMDQLVTMQQDKLAKLQAALAEAQESEKQAREQALAEQKAAAENVVADAGDTLEAGVQNVTGDIAEGVAGATAQVGDTLSQSADTLSQSADALVDNGAGDAAAVVAAADPDAETVELANADEQNSLATQTAAATEAPVAAAPEGPWYQNLFTRNGAIIGGAAGLTIAGLFLLLRRRKPDDEELLDQVEFIDDENDLTAAPVAAGKEPSADDFGGDEFGADMTGENVSLDESMEKKAEVHVGGAAAALAADDTLNVNAQATESNDLPDDTASHDDTISEAEVYLAYGLHGQAEDLLTKAVEQNPANPEYRVKLLQTYHAQRNQPAFEEAAAKYHQDFGGAASPEWDTIRTLGEEINPSNELFLSDSSAVESLGKGNFDGPKLDPDDFVGDDSEQAISQIREFSSSDDEAASNLDTSGLEIDESDLMDQSLDPGFAFDENDLEATGDFSQIADELNQEQAANESTAKPAASLDDGIIEFDAPELTTLDETQMAVDQVSDESIAQDLSMDLDQLSGDMELDTTEILDGGLDISQDLEMPDLTTDADLTADATSGSGDVDEMDTMMDLAKAYIDMGDNDSASSALGEIVKSGSPEQKTEAENLLRKIP